MKRRINFFGVPFTLDVPKGIKYRLKASVLRSSKAVLKECKDLFIQEVPCITLYVVDGHLYVTYKWELNCTVWVSKKKILPVGSRTEIRPNSTIKVVVFENLGVDIQLYL